MTYREQAISLIAYVQAHVATLAPTQPQRLLGDTERGGCVSADTSAVLIATVGVLGTLGAPIVSQWLATRTKRVDFEMRKSERLDDFRLTQGQTDAANKRACYIAFMVNARRYRLGVTNYLDKVKVGAVDKAERDELGAARRAYLESFAEIQLTASLQALAAIQPFNDGLSEAYRAAKQFENQGPKPGGSVEEVKAFLDKLWDQWNDMREAMRNDLGVEE